MTKRKLEMDNVFMCKYKVMAGVESAKWIIVQSETGEKMSQRVL